MTIPVPLVQAGVDLRDFPFMPLDVVRLRDSDIAAISSGEEFRCAVLIWCASWHQVPAASIPDDDIVLAQLSGFGRVVKDWKRVREGALRGWIKCSDGRLYHPVVAEKANEAWSAKMMQRWKTECARIKKYNQRHNTRLPFPEFEAFLSQQCPSGHSPTVPRDRTEASPPCPPGNTIQGTGIGTVINHTHSARPRSPDQEFAMEADWQPSAGFVTVAKLSGWHKPVPEGAVGEFASYWLGRPGVEKTEHGWDHAFVQSLKAQDLRSPRAPAATAAVSRKSFRQQDAEASMERWEEMTGQIHPDRQPAESGRVIDAVTTTPAIEDHST